MCLKCFEANLNSPPLRSTRSNWARIYQPAVLLVEDQGSGQSLLQELKTETSLPLKPIKPDTDKFTRASAITPLVESGRLFLPSNDTGGWVEEFVRELTAFPAAPHDDQVDALVQALHYLRYQQLGIVTQRELVIGGGGRRLGSNKGYNQPSSTATVAGLLPPRTNGVRFTKIDEPDPEPVPSGPKISALPGHEPGGLMNKR